MAVLQFSGTPPAESSTDQQQKTESSASPTKEERIPIPSPRKTPSPVKSVSSNISSTSLSAGYGTTPVTSNLAFYHSRAVAVAANNVGQQQSANYNNLVFGNSSSNMMQYQQQQSFAAANGMQQYQQPISFMQMSNMQQQQQQQPVYMANNALPQNELSNAHHMHINRRDLLPPLNNTSMNSNISPLLPRRGQRNNGMNSSGMNNPQPPWNMLNAHNQHMMMGTNNNIISNTTKNNLLGPVTVGGIAGRIPMNNLQRRIPITQPVGGAGLGSSANPQSGDLNNYAQVAANRNRMVNNNGMVVNNSDGMSVFGNRNRVIGSSSRPPLPMASPGTAAAPNDQQQQQQQQYHQLDLQRSPTPLRNNSNNNVLTNPNPIEYQHPDVGLDGDFVGGVIEDATAYNLSTCTPEIGLSTGLVTLSVHEALTFDGVELALHPDVFKGSKKKGGGKDDTSDNQNLRPGDLVEIRVWVARPGMAAENSTSPQSKGGGGGSTIQSRMNPGLARPSLHNRDTSLHTVGSSLTNTSLMNTPRSMLGVKQFASGQAPPLPRVIGGTTPPIGHSPSTSITSVDRLFGENLVASASESVDGWSGVLHGEHLLETPKPNQHQISPGAASNLSLSSVISGAASSLFRKVAAPSHSSHTSEDSPSVLGHSRSGSDVSALHSRDSSLIGNGGSWTNVLNTSSNNKESPPQISPGLDSSPSSAVLQSVAEGLPQQPHPLLVTNLSQHSMTSPESSQILPMRRGSNSSQTQSLVAPPPPPLHPLSAAASESSTPNSSQPPSPKKERSIFTPPASSSKPTPPSTTSKPTPPSTASKSLNKKPPTSHRPPMSNSMDSSMSQEQVDAPLGNTSLPISILSPDITSIVTGTETNRRRTSSSDGPPRPDLPIRISGEAPSSSHNRNNTITGGLVTSGSSHLNVPPHRRYRSGNNIPAISHVDSMMSVAGSSIMNNSIEPAIDINESLQRTHFVRISFVIPVSEGSLTSIKSSARTRVSLLRRVAELYNITAYDTVTVTQVTRSNEPLVHQSISADFLTITFKDQFVSRGDMYTFQKSFLNSWVYEGKRLSFNGMRTNTKVIRHGDHVVRSGLITEDTKLTFRSRSARIIWLVQISSEMWEQACPYEAVGHQTSHESSCKIYYDKFIEFVRRLFDKWKKLQLTHNLTVVFFSRTYIRHPDITEERRSSSFVHVDSDGRLYEDHYRIVLENETTADDKLIHKLKKEFVSYPKGVKWNLSLGNERTPSTASQGNVLEAINITLNLLQLHYIDRDLHRTGNSIVIITPGNGVFEIEKNLAGITKQRMMDNGIGSDMVSLGLPPLHVAPFFLYKEREASAAEETQGYKVEGVDQTYFELPHWMNLSFVDYDEEEEGPILYKENDDDDNFLDTTNVNNNVDGEDEPHVQTWSASNGFLKRINNSSVIQETNQQPVPIGSARQQRYKNLIRDRGFEDILQACRPRSRGEYGSGLPVSLTNLLKKVARPVTITRSETDDNLKMANLNRDSQQLASLGDMARASPQRALDTSKSRYLEWGTVNFDAFPQRRFSNAQHQPYNSLNRSFSGSHGSSPSSSLGSYRFPSHLLSISHLQSTASLGSDGQSVSSGHQSNGSMATPDNEQDAPSGIDELKKFMSDYDTSTFSNTPTGVHAKSGNISQSLLEDSLRNSPNEPICPGSPRGSPVKGLLRSQSALLFPAFNKNKGSGSGGGGIEAALNQYDGTSLRQRKDGVTSPRGDFLEYKISEDVQVGSSSLAVSPLSSSIGMHFSLDRRNDGLRPSAMRLVPPVPEAMPSERFLPLDTTQRRSSFQLSQKPKMPTRDHSYNQLKSSGQIGLSGSRLKEDHTSSANKESSKKALPLKRGTSKGKKHRQRTPGRHRRKPWVLNPFRQEDEDEVLAKRTHNRRRWSHVFPLGEDEFKRHAGPNWKSLCQPAILPLTIDYYPTPQDLNDEKLFSVKQYSVTLPPLEERTSYKSHKELLDDLLIQRMRQDFQIVPRAIIQHASRDTATADNMLEATLSMGHKIQKLSYNPSSDSVDVIQYYARFAEDETPQTYRYMLWSALKQDYVSVFQPFTKYTRPYKWNELDMLISGDAVTTILEGMRYPRISFVIMPDKFVDAEGEKEYVEKFQRLVEYFGKVQEARDDLNGSFNIEIHLSNDDYPQASSGAERFVIDLTKDKKKDKYEWMELAHDSNCDTRRTFRMTIQWLVAVASKIDQQAQRLSSRCKREGLTLISVPHFSCLRSCFLNPFAVPITKPIRDKYCVDLVENALTKDFDFVYDGTHMSDPNEIDSLDGFDFAINKWSIKKRKKLVPARQYLHRSGVLFMRLLRDARGCAIIITYLNSRHIAGDEEQLQSARIIYYNVDQYIAEVCKGAGFKSE